MRDPAWTMPEWMEPYRDLFQNTGGNSVENLMRDTTTTAFNNAIRSTLIISVSAQVDLLHRLRSRGMLAAPEGEDVQALRAAIEDEGVAPGHHREIMARHRSEWPTLWRAIDAILEAGELDR